MKYLIIILSFLSLVITLKDKLANYSLIFKEDFKSIDNFEANWDFEIGTGDNGWGNGEKQYYRTSKDNIFIQDNQLHIKAIKNKLKNNEYTSGRLTTKKTFQFAYGYLKTRIKLPKAKGIWPAFWMIGENVEEVGWPNCGEIDIVETKNDNDIVINSVHWFDNGSKDRGDYGSENIVPNKDEFHIYELLWEENYIKMYIDDKQTYIINIEQIATNAFTKQFNLILNLAVGGNFPGNDIDNSKFPLEMIIDYIEVYQKNYIYKFSPKSLAYEMAPEIKPWINLESDNLFLKDGMLHLRDFYRTTIPTILKEACFKYGEIKMEVSLPDEKGISNKIYLFNRESFYYYIKEEKGEEKYYIERDKTNNGEIGIITTKDGSHKIISGSKWGEGDYFKEINEFDPTEFNEYLFKWDENYIIIYANDIEIYKLDIKFLPDFRKYYFLYLIIERTNEKYKGNTPEMRFKKLKIYQYVNDTILGLPTLDYLPNGYIRFKINIWLLFIIFLIQF